MSSLLETNPNIESKAIDGKTLRSNKIVSYYQSHSVQLPCFKPKAAKSVIKSETGLQAKKKIDENDLFALFKRRVTSPRDVIEKEEKDYRSATENKKQRKLKTENDEPLPYLKKSKYAHSEHFLKSLGYNKDTRVFSEKYSDTVEERKAKYVSKMEVLQRQFENCPNTKKLDLLQRTRMQSKLLSEEIKRKREREMTHKIKKEEEKLFYSLLNPNMNNIERPI